MADPHYTPSGNPVQGSAGVSKEFRDEFQLIEDGIEVLNDIPVQVQFEDANNSISRFVGIPFACKVVRVYMVNDAANATAACGFTIEIAGVPVVLDTDPLEFLLTATAATVISSIISASNTVTAGGTIEIDPDNGGSTVMPVTVTLMLQRT